MREQRSADGFGFPRVTAERMQGCVGEYHGQLPDGSWAFSPRVDVDRNGKVIEVDPGEIPRNASDLASCTRNALREMEIPSEILKIRRNNAQSGTNELTNEQRSAMASPAVVVVVIVGLSELVFEAGAYTILFAVTVKVVDKAVDDVAEATKRRRNPKDECTDHYTKCMATAASDADGNHWKQTLCGICARVCVNNVINKSGSWPSHVGNGSCEYWVTQWN